MAVRDVLDPRREPAIVRRMLSPKAIARTARPVLAAGSDSRLGVSAPHSAVGSTGRSRTGSETETEPFCGLNYGPWYSTDTTRLAWNALGQAVRIEHWNAGGAHTVDSLFYDALGRRVAKQVTGRPTQWYVYDGDQIVMDVDSTGALTAEYAYLGEADLLGMRTPTDTLVALSTATNGTIVGMARARDGAEVKRYPVLNTPWSQQMADTGLVVRFKMGGQEYDQETGLYHLGARYYDPQLGRFLSEDPIGIAGGLNLYAYADNDPVNFSDPSGLKVCQPGFIEVQDVYVMRDFSTGQIIMITKLGDSYCVNAGGTNRGTDGPGGGAQSGSRGPTGSQAAQRPKEARSCVMPFLSALGEGLFDLAALAFGVNEARVGLSLMKLGGENVVNGGFALARSALGTGLSNPTARELLAGGAAATGAGLRVASGAAVILVAPHLSADNIWNGAKSGVLHVLNPFSGFFDKRQEYIDCLDAQALEAN